MPEINRPVHFERLSADNTGAIAKIEQAFFESGIFTSADLKKYTNEIIEEIKQLRDEKEQQIFLLDCLRDDKILEILFLKYSDQQCDKDSIEMISDTIKAIKKKIIYDLEPYLSPDMYLFIQKNLFLQTSHFNKKRIVHDKKFTKYFMKETNLYPEIIANIREGLKILKAAIKKLKETGQDMPYIINPEIIDDPKNALDIGSVYYTTKEKKFIDFGSIIRYDSGKFTSKQKLEAVLDCLKGAKFIADAGLTLTDLHLANMAIDKQSGNGIIFDLDGLIKTGKKSQYIVAPQPYDPDYYPPEYRRDPNRFKMIADSSSMIWEIGYNLDCLITKLEQNNLKEAIKKLRELAKDMKSENPDNRPTFTDCINRLNDIINKYLPQTP